MRSMVVIGLLVMLSAEGVRAGAEAYHLLMDIQGDIDMEGSFVEVGSDRGEGSTAWLHSFASQTGRDFFSVDFSEEGFNNAKRACGSCGFRGMGETFLESQFLEVSKFGKIAFAYLDNYDWVWAGEHPESYTLQFPAMLEDQQLSQYKLKMRKEYREVGLTMNNEKSQRAHLQQAVQVHKLCTERCIILFDDTFPLGTNLFSGKGGAAMKYLLDNERFEIISQSEPSNPSYEGYVMVRRLPRFEDTVGEEFGSPEEIEAIMSSRPQSNPDLPTPTLTWVNPKPSAALPCCSTSATLKVSGAVTEEHTLVVFIDLLERFRRLDWSDNPQEEDEVTFDVALPGAKSVMLGAHIVTLDQRVLVNSTQFFEFVNTEL